ncbi:MAG TPA: acyl-CoA thioester hydrolase/BAAT C-terminal domain-containing protein [Nonomuraea sp.]|nr:acyl-CoA thioester hydrolase/BAAT C-terminal domain-containing protein [Nonomuraea sp.]
MSIRWFGGPGQSPGICEVPLETFVSAVDLLESTGVRRICLLGSSKGAEAALLTSVHDPRVDGVVAMSPTSVVWGNVGPGRDGQQRPYRSSWTWKGQPLPFVPYDDDWTAAASANGPVAVRGWYEQSERTFADLVLTAEIPVEEANGDVLLVAGGDDAMWPSLPFAERLVVRRRTAGRTARLISRADAGHRPRLPGEGPASASPHFLHGGDAAADAELGAAAWPHILNLLRG